MYKISPNPSLLKRGTIKSSKGQTLVESVFFIPIIAMIIFAIMWFARIVITKQQLVSAARYGTDLILYTSLNEKEVKEEIKNYLSHHWIKGRKLDPHKLKNRNIKVKIDKFYLPKAESFSIYNPLDFTNKLKDTFENLIYPLNHTSYVEIYYEFDTPRIFALINNDKIMISARSEVLAGTGMQ